MSDPFDIRIGRVARKTPLTSILEDVGKLLPSAVETEEAVLGALMLERDAIDEIVKVIEPDSFYKDEHVEIYTAILALHKKDESIDLLTVVNELRSTGRLEYAGGAFYISELTNRISSSANVFHHALIVQQKYMLRRLIAVSSNSMRDAYDEMSGDVFETITKAIKDLEALLDIKLDKAEQKLVDVAREINQDLINGKEEKPSGVSSTFKRFDSQIGLLMNGCFIIIGARSGQGKTALTLSILYNLAKIHNIKVAIFSYEMTNKQLGARILAKEMDISAGDILRRNLLSGKMSEMNNHLSMLNDVPLWMDDSTDDDIIRLIKKMRQFKKKYDIDVFAVDYIQIIPALESDRKGKMTNRDTELGVITRKFKKAAKEMDVPIIGLSQLSRKVDERKDKRPVLSDLRECLSTDTSMIYSKNNLSHNQLSKVRILSLNKQNKISSMESINIPKTKNEVFRLKLNSGRFLDCTANHPILTTEGYKKLSEINKDDSIAVALGWDDKGKYIPESRFIGWMLGNGSMVGYHSPAFITKDPIISEDFVSFIEDKFGWKPKWHPHHKSAVFQWDLTHSSTGNRTKEINPARAWLKENNLWGNTAAFKSIPDWFMEQADEKSICELIQGLYETDGSISMGKRESIKYATTSLKFANQILYLLARLGILSHIDDGYKSKVATCKCYGLYIYGSEFKKRFQEKILLRGYKGERLSKLVLSERASFHSNKIGRNTTLKIAAIINPLHDKNCRVQIHGTRRLTKQSFQSIFLAHQKELEKYQWLLSEHIYWDGVESITSLGEAQVFDRSVPITNNFIVNGIIVHNSGSIENDADMVMFIYRPEEYGESTEIIDNIKVSTEGLAEIIIAKNRWGKHDTFVPLRWTGKTTSFSDWEESSEPLFAKNNEPMPF